MSPVIRVVANCTDRKRLAPASDLLLRSYPDDLELRARAWTERIRNAATPGTRASHLYQGEHWAIVTQLDQIATAQGLTLDLWVASAGYGLIRADDAIDPYGATFAPGSPDSITRSVGKGDVGSNSEYWWSRLNDRERPDRLPTSLSSLAAQRPGDPLVIVLSASYTRALRTDLLAAAECLDQPENLLLVSTGTSDAELERFRVPASAKFQHAFGGTRLSLNARIARRILETTGDHGWDGQAVRSQLAAELERQPAIVHHDRRPLTDTEVISFIHAELAESPRASRSLLLRRLRDRNQACEQKRFGRLFEVATQGST